MAVKRRINFVFIWLQSRTQSLGVYSVNRCIAENNLGYRAHAQPRLPLKELNRAATLLFDGNCIEAEAVLAAQL